MQGVVTKTTGSWYIVKTKDGILRECRIKGKFSDPRNQEYESCGSWRLRNCARRGR